MKSYTVYILTNASRTALYIGITNRVLRRQFEHKHKLESGFTSKYNVNRLVYCETRSEVEAAIAREKQLKGWRRSKKVDLIESQNPKWDDLGRVWDEVYKPDSKT